MVWLGCSEDWSGYCQLLLTGATQPLLQLLPLGVPPPPVLNLVHLLCIFRGRKEEGKGWKFPVGGVTLRLTQQSISSGSGKHCLVPKLHPSPPAVRVDFTGQGKMLFHRANKVSDKRTLLHLVSVQDFCLLCHAAASRELCKTASFRVLFYEMSILNWNWDKNLAVAACSIPTSSGLKGQESFLSLVQLRHFLFSNSTEFHLIPSSSHSTEKHSQLLLACIGCQTADCLDYTGLYCVPAGTRHTKCFLWDQGSLLGCTSTPGAVLKLEIPRQQADLHMLLSEQSLLSLSLQISHPITQNSHWTWTQLWLSLLQQRDPVFCLLSSY